MAIQWTAPAAETINEGATARQWMMPGGEYVMEAAASGGASGGATQPVLFITT